MVIVPQQVEQLLIGQALAQHGAALVLREHLARRRVPPEALRAAVGEILTMPSYQTAAVDLAAAFRSEGGASTAASAIIDFLHTAH